MCPSILVAARKPENGKLADTSRETAAISHILPVSRKRAQPLGCVSETAQYMRDGAARLVYLGKYGRRIGVVFFVNSRQAHAGPLTQADRLQTQRACATLSSMASGNLTGWYSESVGCPAATCITPCCKSKTSDAIVIVGSCPGYSCGVRQIARGAPNVSRSTDLMSSMVMLPIFGSSNWRARKSRYKVSPV